MEKEIPAAAAVYPQETEDGGLGKILAGGLPRCGQGLEVVGKQIRRAEMADSWKGQGKLPQEVVTDNALLRRKYENEEL